MILIKYELSTGVSILSKRKVCEVCDRQTDRQISHNETFLLVKCIRWYV